MKEEINILNNNNNSSNTDETPNSNEQTRKYYENTLLLVEVRIKNNQFRSKQELSNYLINLKNSGIPEDVLSNEKMKELLDEYDKLHSKEEPSLDMSNYKCISLGDQNYIVSKETGVILKTEGSKEQLSEEFKSIQNQLTSIKQNGLANADEIFEYMRNSQKEEVNIVTIEAAINRDKIDTEILNKIKFFISNEYINPYEYRVSPENGIFYNLETSEVLEVRKNEETGEYAIYKGEEIVYGNNDTLENSQENNMEKETPEIESMTNEEEIAYENGLKNQNVKVRRLVPPQNYNNRAAFAKIGFLLVGIITFSIITAIMILTRK